MCLWKEDLNHRSPKWGLRANFGPPAIAIVMVKETIFPLKDMLSSGPMNIIGSVVEIVFTLGADFIFDI